MNRRNFIKSSGILATATLLPKAVLSQTEYCTRSNYYGSKSSTDTKEYWKFSGKICEKMTANFNAARDVDKEFELSISYYKNGISNGITQKGKYVYIVKRVDTNEDTKTAVCQARLKSTDKDGYSLPKSFYKPKRITLTLRTDGKVRKITIASKKGDLTTIRRTLSSSSKGCYLTTACVETHGLSDNCIELETLRSLRELHIKTSPNGRSLLCDYDTYAPQLVSKIDSFENRKEIYGFMYRYMIVPAVILIQTGNTKKAIELYKEYSELLFTSYMKN